MTTDDAAETQERPELPTELAPPVEYPAEPEAWSAAQDLPTVKLWRNPWTRVWGGVITAILIVAVAGYIAGTATHPRTVVEHAPPAVTITHTVTKPAPPDDNQYLAALDVKGIHTVDRKSMVAQAYAICSKLFRGDSLNDVETEVFNGNPGLDSRTQADTIVTATQQFYCPSAG
jgi:hypothetical protein